MHASAALVGGRKLLCLACRQERNLRAELWPFDLNSKFGVFACIIKGCMYPLNTKDMRKFVFKFGPDGEAFPCDPSEVPNLKDLHALLSSAMVNSSNIGPASPNNSAPPADIIQVTNQVPEKYDNPRPEKVALIPNEACNISVSSGARFGTSSKVFPIWKNRDSLCWLDSTLCLLVHSKNLKMHFKSETLEECQLKTVMAVYDEAVSVLNSKCGVALPNTPFEQLENVRERTFEFLQSSQRCEKGQEDSPIFSIMALLKQNRSLNDLFLLRFALELRCSSCGYVKSSENRKNLVTIPGVLEDFTENQLVYLRPCFQCQKPDQKITLKFLKLPRILLIHFVEGLPHSNIQLYDMVLSQQGYYVSAFIEYKKVIRHFITWVRDDTGDKWMSCDDLKPSAQIFQPKIPDISSTEIYLVMWEQKERSGGDNLHLHYSGTQNCNDSLSKIESSPPLITLDSDSESELPVSDKPLCTVNDPPPSGERMVITCGGQQPQIKGNISSSPSSKPFSPSSTSLSTIGRELNKSFTCDSRQDAGEDLVPYSSSDSRARERHREQQESPIQNIFSITQKLPCQIQANSDATKEIPTEKKLREKLKTMCFGTNPNENNSRPKRQMANASVRSSAVSQEVSVEKRRKVVGKLQEKKVKGETPVSPLQNLDCNKSENYGDQSVLDDTRLDVNQVKSRDLSQEAPAVFQRAFYLL